MSCGSKCMDASWMAQRDSLVPLCKEVLKYDESRGVNGKHDGSCDVRFVT